MVNIRARACVPNRKYKWVAQRSLKGKHKLRWLIPMLTVRSVPSFVNFALVVGSIGVCVNVVLVAGL